MEKPNILFIMSDDHAAHALSCYGSEINETPNLDRIANEGMRFDNCFCTNSICAPSRATILTGKYNHLNGVKTLKENLDGRQDTFPKFLQKNGYQTAIVGKWHLGHGGVNDPTGFDYWNVLPGQGDYHDPEMIEMGETKQYEGYVTDIITDLSLDWLRYRNQDKPFCLLYHHKAPHRPWLPDKKHAEMYKDEVIPEPDTFNDDYENRASAAREAKMRIDDDLREGWDIKVPIPQHLSGQNLKKWKYQQYIKDYLRVVASIDDNVGRVLNYLDEEGLADNTIVIYTSDQGFFLGDHGWYDKRFIYEESLKMPFIVRYPEEIEAGSVCDDMILNTDFAPTFLDYAGIDIPEDIQGESLRPLFQGKEVEDWRDSIYYRYWMYPSMHNVYPHYGLRTERYKLVYYYTEGVEHVQELKGPEKPEWELFDLAKDPNEMRNVYDDPAYQEIVEELRKELYRKKEEVKDFE